MSEPTYASHFQVESTPASVQSGALPGGARLPRIDVRIDYENIHIAMKERGYDPDPAHIIRVLHGALAGLGEVICIRAYADWGMLDPENGLRLQKTLADLGVEVIYVSNRRGKNSADMRIVRDLRDALEVSQFASRQFEYVAIVSGDRDFTDVLFSARERGKGGIVMGFRGSLSAELRRSATRWIYLDEFFISHRCSPHDPLARLAMVTAALARHSADGWAPAALLNSAGVEAEIRAGMDQGLLLWDIARGAARLNPEHPLARAAGYLVEWAPQKIAEALYQRGLPCVYTRFLINGINYDSHMSGLGIVGGSGELEGWLDLLEAAGVLESAPTFTQDGQETRCWKLKN